MSKYLLLYSLCLGGMLAVLGFGLSSCERDLEVQTAFPFELTMLPIPKQLEAGETAELRCHLSAEGLHDQTLYTLRYFQYEGKGELRLGRGGTLLQPNDRYRITTGEFRLYYTSRSRERQQIELVFEDSHKHQKTITLDFNHKQTQDDDTNKH